MVHNLPTRGEYFHILMIGVLRESSRLIEKLKGINYHANDIYLHVLTYVLLCVELGIICSLPKFKILQSKVCSSRVNGSRVT